ncbi:zinc-binding dehydrogenase [Billgrantia endophytica]|uniref:Zinc-binding dehydrogenase n=1 Tax=Billgrantia endophytica TaxID=2033802 RepID=A0A2N7U6Q2_9GAMM|nr:zinc-binding dehydrogenase [Halomonas endophytica]PMR76107.1 zinc-binding dehydrogenase [Halomonas endophytica]
MISQMRALVLSEHGNLDQLQVVDDYALPIADKGHVVIRVGASSYNYHDVFTVKGMPGIKVPLPVIIGLDIAGTITEIGPDIEGWKTGDRVLVNPLKPNVGLMGEMVNGGMAEYARVDVNQLIRLPDQVSFEQAASLPVAYGTAHRMLITHDTIKTGDRVMILGASGGVGTACVVLAKLLGAEVIACVGSDSKGERLKSLGADHTVNYRTTDFSKWAIAEYGKPQRRTYEGGVDVVINFTGGETWVPSLKCLKRGGKLLVCGATAGHDPKEDLRYVWSFELEIKGSNSFYKENLEALLQLVADKKIDPVIDRILPLEHAAAGLALIRDREVLGKVVVTP